MYSNSEDSRSNCLDYDDDDDKKNLFISDLQCAPKVNGRREKFDYFANIAD
jgi:hypothetical protein